MPDDFSCYIACLASYNAGILHGDWIDLSFEKAEWEIDDEIQDILKSSPIPNAEEWAVHDWDTPVKLSLLGEYHNVEELALMSELFGEFESNFLHLWAYIGDPLSNIRDAMKEVCHFTDWDEVLDNWIEQHEVPELVVPFLDQEHILREIQMERSFIETDNGLLETLS